VLGSLAEKRNSIACYKEKAWVFLVIACHFPASGVDESKGGLKLVGPVEESVSNSKGAAAGSSGKKNGVVLIGNGAVIGGTEKKIHQREVHGAAAEHAGCLGGKKKILGEEATHTHQAAGFLEARDAGWRCELGVSCCRRRR